MCFWCVYVCVLRKKHLRMGILREATPTHKVAITPKAATRIATHRAAIHILKAVIHIPRAATRTATHREAIHILKEATLRVILRGVILQDTTLKGATAVKPTLLETAPLGRRSKTSANLLLVPDSVLERKQ